MKLKTIFAERPPFMLGLNQRIVTSPGAIGKWMMAGMLALAVALALPSPPMQASRHLR